MRAVRLALLLRSVLVSRHEAADCPLDFPFAYGPSNNLNRCCATADDCRGNAKANSNSDLALRSDCCSGNASVPCASSPCGDFAGRGALRGAASHNASASATVQGEPVDRPTVEDDLQDLAEKWLCGFAFCCPIFRSTEEGLICIFLLVWFSAWNLGVSAFAMTAALNLMRRRSVKAFLQLLTNLLLPHVLLGLVLPYFVGGLFWEFVTLWPYVFRACFLRRQAQDFLDQDEHSRRSKAAGSQRAGAGTSVADVGGSMAARGSVACEILQVNPAGSTSVLAARSAPVRMVSASSLGSSKGSKPKDEESFIGGLRRMHSETFQGLKRSFSSRSIGSGVASASRGPTISVEEAQRRTRSALDELRENSLQGLSLNEFEMAHQTLMTSIEGLLQTTEEIECGIVTVSEVKECLELAAHALKSTSFMRVSELSFELALRRLKWEFSKPESDHRLLDLDVSSMKTSHFF
mmetsp:Transcript_143932/g.460722  ORF Transcript_143932/g.460722 Transcript_143932/m.460722 type:complete len:464 (+) Transcript_143932:85-1476(+)